MQQGAAYATRRRIIVADCLFSGFWHTKKRPHYCTDALLDHIEFHLILLVYPKIVVRLPPTIIEVVLTPSITRQNVIRLILLSFKFGYCECFLWFYYLSQMIESSHAANPTIATQAPINVNIYFTSFCIVFVYRLLLKYEN